VLYIGGFESRREINGGRFNIANNITIHSGGQVAGANPVPEPTTLLLFGSGMVGVAAKCANGAKERANRQSKSPSYKVSNLD